jgi:hypothetical protein
MRGKRISLRSCPALILVEAARAPVSRPAALLGDLSETITWCLLGHTEEGNRVARWHEQLVDKWPHQSNASLSALCACHNVQL